MKYLKLQFQEGISRKAISNSLLLMMVFANETVMAQAWAQRTKSTIDKVIAGLKTLGIGIATLCLLWSAYQIIWGGKRLQDMIPFFIGAGIFLAGPELAQLFFGS